MTGEVTRDEAIKRLLDHQIAELGMLVPHIDGVGRAMTMMRLELKTPPKSSAAGLVRLAALFRIWTSTDKSFRQGISTIVLGFIR